MERMTTLKDQRVLNLTQSQNLKANRNNFKNVKTFDCVGRQIWGAGRIPLLDFRHVQKIFWARGQSNPGNLMFSSTGDSFLNGKIKLLTSKQNYSPDNSL